MECAARVYVGLGGDGGRSRDQQRWVDCPWEGGCLEEGRLLRRSGRGWPGRWHVGWKDIGWRVAEGKVARSICVW